MTDATAPGGGELLLSSAKGKWVIAATVLGSGIAIIDSTVVGIALPTIGRDFHSQLGPLQWVVTGYTLTLASFLLIGGALGDRYGRRKIFMLGVSWFALTSIACAVSPDTSVLIVMRVLQGIGGALLTPGSLAIIQASFAEQDRSNAIGAWSGFGGFATATGPLLGGYLVTAISWRAIFFINVPIAAVVLALSARHVPESRDPTANSFKDIPGAALAVVSLASINYSLIEGSSLGWTSAAVIASICVAVCSTVSFLVIETHLASPMLRLAIFKIRQFSVTNAVTFAVYGGLAGALFLLPIELQVVSHYSPLEAGVSLLPVTLMMLVFSARSGRIAGRIGPRLQMSLGPVVIAGAFLLLVRATTGPGYLADVFPGVFVLGAGLAITVAPLTATVMGAVEAEHSGVASAVNNDVSRIAGLITVAILPWLAGITGNLYLHPHALSDGFKTAMYISAGLCLVGGLLALIGIRNPTKTPRTDTSAKKREAPSFHCALDGTPVTSVPD